MKFLGMNTLRSLLPARHWPVLGTLLLSLSLRWVLILRGGQIYFPDEVRYFNSVDAAIAILQGDFSSALETITVSAVHIGFRAIAVFPALAENYFHLSALTPSYFFSIFSVLSLYLIWRIAQCIGMSERASFFALFISASSHTLIYFSRHLLPYDLALFFGLLALFVGLDEKTNLQGSVFSGILSFMCFVCYNGYWPLAGVVVILPALININNSNLLLRKVFFAIIGFVFSFILLTIIMSITSAGSSIKDYWEFSQSVNQGSYSEGWSLPFEYLWHADHFFLVVLLIFSLYAVTHFSTANRKVLFIGVGGAFIIYLCLSIPSTVLQTFVVYGRLSRQLIPFLSLSTAYGLYFLSRKGGIANQLVPIVLLFIFVQGAINYRSSYFVSYPVEFIKLTQTQYPEFKISIKRAYIGAPPVCRYKNYIATNAKYYYPLPESVPDIKAVPLISIPHPMNFYPYQYEGYTPEERQVFRDRNINMELYLVDLEEDLALLDGLTSCKASKP